MKLPPTPADPDALRAAIESDDYSSADIALRNYITCFHSSTRTLAEVASARDLFESAIQTAVAHRARTAEQLACLTAVFSSYCPPRISNTWHVEA